MLISDPADGGLDTDASYSQFKQATVVASEIELRLAGEPVTIIGPLLYDFGSSSRLFIVFVRVDVRCGSTVARGAGLWRTGGDTVRWPREQYCGIAPSRSRLPFIPLFFFALFLVPLFRACPETAVFSL